MVKFYNKQDLKKTLLNIINIPQMKRLIKLEEKNH